MGAQGRRGRLVWSEENISDIGAGVNSFFGDMGVATIFGVDIWGRHVAGDLWKPWGKIGTVKAAEVESIFGGSMSQKSISGLF